MATYGYGRVSTDNQDRSLEGQRDSVETYAAANGLTLDGWFEDDAVSASVAFFERPVGSLVNAKLRNGDTIIASNYDRLFRSSGDCERTIDDFNKRGVSIVVLDMQLDTRSSIGRAMASMMGVIKRLERDTIAQRMADGLIRTCGGRHNLWMLSSTAATGWVKIAKFIYEPDHKRRSDVAEYWRATKGILEEPESFRSWMNYSTLAIAAVCGDPRFCKIQQSGKHKGKLVLRDRMEKHLIGHLLGWPLAPFRQVASDIVNVVAPGKIVYSPAPKKCSANHWQPNMHTVRALMDPDVLAEGRRLSDEITRRNKEAMEILRIRDHHRQQQSRIKKRTRIAGAVNGSEQMIRMQKMHKLVTGESVDDGDE